MRRNLNIIYATSALNWGRFFLPVLALFYIASNVTIGEFGIIMGASALAMLILEIPASIAADFLGKKHALIIARSSYVIEIIILAFTNSLWPLLIGRIIGATGQSLASGTENALLHDTLRRSYREHRHEEIQRRITTTQNVSIAVVFTAGAYLFTIDPKLPAIASLPLLTIALILTMFLKEPYRPNKHAALSNIGRHLKETMAYFRRHRYVRHIVFYAMPLTAATSIAFALSSAYYEHIKVPIAAIGIIAAATAFITAYAAKHAHKVEQEIGEKDSRRYLPVFLIIGILLLSLTFPYVGIAFYLFIALAAGYLATTLDDYINKHIEATHRTTMISINNLFTNLAIALLFPLTAILAGMISIGAAYAILAGILSLYMTIFFILHDKRPY